MDANIKKRLDGAYEFLKHAEEKLVHELEYVYEHRVEIAKQIVKLIEEVRPILHVIEVAGDKLGYNMRVYKSAIDWIISAEEFIAKQFDINIANNT